MLKNRFITFVASALLIAVFVVIRPYPPQAQATNAGNECGQPNENVLCAVSEGKGLTNTLEATAMPKIATRAWQQKAARNQVVTYSVTTRGVISADVAEFAQLAQETYSDSRGWSRLGVTFTQVANGGDFTLVLSAANQMTSFSALGCDATYSCQVGRYVIINQDRWLTATPAWNNAHGTLRNYRHMVINHETGHWLGHGHAQCANPGDPAAVMQQQSISLQGCTFNPWPITSELYSPRLGISL